MSVSKGMCRAVAGDFPFQGFLANAFSLLGRSLKITFESHPQPCYGFIESKMIHAKNQTEADLLTIPGGWSMGH